MHMLFALMLLAAGAFVLVMGIRGSYWAAFGVTNPFSTQIAETDKSVKDPPPSGTK